MLILKISDGKTKYGVEMLQSYFLTYTEFSDVPSCALPVNFWFCEDVVKRNIGLSLKQKAMPSSITQWKTKLYLDFYTQLLKGHVGRTLD